MANEENVAARAWRESMARVISPSDNSAAMAFSNGMADSLGENFATRAWRESMARVIGYRADREPDASWYRPSNHRPPSQREVEYRRREEERIRKMKDSFYFKSQKFFGGKEEEILKKMEAEDDYDYRPLLPYAPLKQQY